MTRTKRRHDVRRRIRHAVKVAFDAQRECVRTAFDPEVYEGFASSYLTDYGLQHARRRNVPGSRRLGQTVAAIGRMRNVLEDRAGRPL